MNLNELKSKLYQIHLNVFNVDYDIAELLKNINDIENDVDKKSLEEAIFCLQNILKETDTYVTFTNNYFYSILDRVNLKEKKEI
jgi:hypothetical protein